MAGMRVAQPICKEEAALGWLQGASPPYSRLPLSPLTLLLAVALFFSAFPCAFHPQLCSQHQLLLSGEATQLHQPMPGCGRKLAESCEMLWTALISH